MLYLKPSRTGNTKMLTMQSTSKSTYSKQHMMIFAYMHIYLTSSPKRPQEIYTWRICKTTRKEKESSLISVGLVGYFIASRVRSSHLSSDNLTRTEVGPIVAVCNKSNVLTKANQDCYSCLYTTRLTWLSSLGRLTIITPSLIL